MGLAFQATAASSPHEAKRNAWGRFYRFAIFLSPDFAALYPGYESPSPGDVSTPSCPRKYRPPTAPLTFMVSGLPWRSWRSDRHAHPAFADTIFFYVGALDALEADADVARQQFGVVVRTGVGSDDRRSGRVSAGLSDGVSFIMAVPGSGDWRAIQPNWRATQAR